MCTSLFGPGLRFVQVGVPMGTEFSLYIVCGRDSEGAAVMYLTLSPMEVASMRESLDPVTVHEIRNSTLWGLNAEMKSQVMKSQVTRRHGNGATSTQPPSNTYVG